MLEKWQFCLIFFLLLLMIFGFFLPWEFFFEEKNFFLKNQVLLSKCNNFLLVKSMILDLLSLYRSKYILISKGWIRILTLFIIYFWFISFHIFFRRIRMLRYFFKIMNQSFHLLDIDVWWSGGLFEILGDVFERQETMLEIGCFHWFIYCYFY